MTASLATTAQPCQQMTAKGDSTRPVYQPEPTQLYSVVVVALHVHAASKTGMSCMYCGDAWPCQSLRLACRLLDGL